ncbi:MAG: hypothetical protein A2W27_07450 [Deltaproteobacteria bacterium RBG_16_44_11]|nr:MAG: hypothetical protein A2W27_07450 [Deltaproteobacteria bacterium RBG_16_44_11]
MEAGLRRGKCARRETITTGQSKSQLLTPPWLALAGFLLFIVIPVEDDLQVTQAGIQTSSRRKPGTGYN